MLELHETRVHARPRREIRDLGDGVLLYDPEDREPFWNRLGAIRWPAAAAAFDARLAEALTLFGSLDRMPHVWPRPAFNEPPDVVDRLLAAGFEDVGGGHVMVLADASRLRGSFQDPRRDPRLTVERLHRVGPAERRDELARDVALVLCESFAVEPDRRDRIIVDTAIGLEDPEQYVTLVRLRGEPVAVARRTTFDGVSYLSAIGTRPSFQGLGLGRLVTAEAARDAVAADSRWTYLGVYRDNDVAMRLYERLGFASVGPPVPDLVLR